MIVLDGIGKRFGGKESLSGVSLQVAPGEILAVMGPSGSGKTTLLRIVAGFESPDEGSVSIDGVEATSPEKSLPPHSRKISMIFQDLALWPHMTASEQLRFVLKKRMKSGQEIEVEIAALLGSVNLHDYAGRYPHQLSGGERQRLAMARALAAKPAYLLMDEPLSSLDPIVKDELEKMILDIQSVARMGIIYVTHNSDEVHALADRVAILDRGRLVRDERKDVLLTDPGCELARRLLRV